ncbi:MAG TPA: PGF-pre-PGF domain-containing protein [Candidatus Omnitrophota bacterium]|nr:PGF-pre-PGF domain-containing protein [Candidatus Omnitrophota bacterium]
MRGDLLFSGLNMKKWAVRTILFVLLIFSVFFIIIVMNQTPVLSATLNNTTANLNPNNWIGNRAINSLVYDSNNRLVYLIGGAGFSTGTVFGVYNRSAGTTSDLGTTEANGDWLGAYPLVTAAYDINHSLIYFAGGTHRTANIFGVYNRTDNLTYNLNNTDVGNWMGSSLINSISYDPAHNLVYIVGSSGSEGSGFIGYYNATSGITYPLNLTDIGNWLNTTALYGIASDYVHDKAYFVGAGGVFGVYNRTDNLTYNLNGTEVGNWIGTSELDSVVYDYKHDKVYLGGNPVIGVYNASNSITYNLNATYIGNWAGTNKILPMAYDGNNLVYLIGSGLFGVFNESDNLSYNLGNTSVNDWYGGVGLIACTYDSNSNLTYLGGATGIFGDYNFSSNVTESLRTSFSNDWIGSSQLYSLASDSVHNLIYIGGWTAGIFGVYNRTINVIENLKGVDPGNWLGYGGLTKLSYDSNNGRVYFIKNSNTWGYYDQATNTSYDLNGTDQNDWINANAAIFAMAYDGKNSTYIGGYLNSGASALFGYYNKSTNITYDLSSKTIPASTVIDTLAADPIHNLVYMGSIGSGASFGVYNRTSNTSTDLGAADTGDWLGTNGIVSSVYDANDNLVYFTTTDTTDRLFGYYNQTSNVSTSSNGARGVLAYDSDRNLLYYASSGGIFGVYNRTSNTTEDLSGTDAGDWIGTQNINSIAYNPNDGLIYLAGDNGIFGTYNRSSNETTIASGAGEVSSALTTNPPEGPAGAQISQTTFIPLITPSQPVTFSVDAASIILTQISIATKINVTSAIIKITAINKTGQADIKIGLPNGTTYQAFQINTTNLNNTAIANVTFIFRVNKSAVNSENLSLSNVTLYRKANSGDKWNSLSTILTGSDNKYYYFTAISPGLSTFLVLVQAKECIPNQLRCFSNQLQMCSETSSWTVQKDCPFGCSEQTGCMTASSLLDTYKIYIFATLGAAVLAFIIVVSFRRILSRTNQFNTGVSLAGKKA